MPDTVSSSLLNEERAREYVEKYDLDGLVSSSRVNTTYLTDFDCLTHVQDRMYNNVPGSGEDYVQVYGMYTRNGERCLILPNSMLFMAYLENNRIENKYVYGRSATSFKSSQPKFDSKLEEDFDAATKSEKDNYQTAGEALIAAFKDFTDDNAVVGMDLDEMSAATKIRLESDLPNFKVKRANETFRFIRMVKSPEELRRLSMASTISEKTLDRVIGGIHPGVSEMETKRILVQSIHSQDGVFHEGHFMIPHGSKAGSMTTPINETFRSNTSGWVDFGCTYGGYFADVGDSFAIGHVDERTVKIYEALSSVIEHCEQVICEGMKCSELNAEAWKVWERSGIQRPPTGMGHALGLEIHEYPRISAAKGDMLRDNSAIRDDIIESSIDIPFEEGMVLAIEAPYLQWGWGGVHVERDIVVQKNGSKRLSDEPRFLRRIN